MYVGEEREVGSRVQEHNLERERKKRGIKVKYQRKFAWMLWNDSVEG